MVEVGELRLDPAQRRVWRGGDEVKLSAKAFALLEAFMRRPGEVVSRGQLLEARVGHRVREPVEHRRRLRSRTLREQIDGRRRRIETVRGVGYRLRADAA